MKGIIIKEFLRKNEITQSSVAKKIGESTQNFSAALNQDDVRTSLVERVAEAIGVPVSAFYGEAYSTATASGNGVAVSGDGNSVNAISERFITLLENKDKQIAKKDEQMDRLLGMLETKVGTTNTQPENQP